ncbi:MAG TPA: MlaD family protein [Solirubrobacteraceae bacterium]
MNTEPNRTGRALSGQISRYRNDFMAVIVLIVVGVLVGGYVLSNERLSAPSWVPIIGKQSFTLKGEFQTGQAVTPGQGQAVTIAGAKIGEISSVDLHNGRALVSMDLTPKYAHYIYRNATMLLRPKTELKDMTVEVQPGTQNAGRIPSGYVIPVSQTAPDVNFEEFLGALDGETRAYLQELLAGAGQGLKNNGMNLSAILKRFPGLARNTIEITNELQTRQANIARSIHNFSLLLEALGEKDKQVSEVIDSSNAVFRTFAEEDRNVQATLHLLPGALSKTRTNLAKVTTAFSAVGTTLKQLHPFASSLASALKQSRPFLRESTPIIKTQIRPFAREIVPVVKKIKPSSQQLAEASPNLTSGFHVFSEFFNELAYNPGPKQAGFLFFLDWANHNFNSVIANADAHGPLGHTLLYFNCNIVPLLTDVAEINPTVRLVLGLFNPPTGAACAATGTATKASSAHAARASSARAKQASALGGVGDLTGRLGKKAKGH